MTEKTFKGCGKKAPIGNLICDDINFCCGECSDKKKELKNDRKNIK